MQARTSHPVNKAADQQQESEDFIKFTPDDQADDNEDFTKRPETRQKCRLLLNEANGEVSYHQERLYAPWMSKTTSEIKNPNVKLHNEIIEFSNYVQPSPKDVEKRTKAIEEYLIVDQDSKSCSNKSFQRLPCTLSDRL